MNLLSVIVPVYNSEKTIERCLKSIMGQTYKNMEIIVIDDGSVDDQSYHICKRLACNDERIKLYKKEHTGVTPTRKAGVNMATGEYIAFVDSDDWIEADYLERLFGNLEESIPDVIITASYIIEQNNQQSCAASVRHMEEGNYSGDRIKKIWEGAIALNGVECSLWNKVCKTSLMRLAMNNVNDAIYLMEDYLVTIQVLLLSKSVRIVDEAGYHYCVRAESLVHSRHKDYLYNLHLLYTSVLEILEKHVYREKLFPCFSQCIRKLLSSVPYFLELEPNKDLKVSYVNVYYPYYGRLKNARVVLYGAGYIGQAYYYHIMRDKESELVAWVDKAFYKYRELETEVISPDRIFNMEFDYIIVAVEEENLAMEIQRELIKKGFSKDIILWNRTKRIRTEL